LPAQGSPVYVIPPAAPGYQSGGGYSPYQTYYQSQPYVPVDNNSPPVQVFTHSVEVQTGSRWVAPIAYLFGWLTGLIILLTESRNSYNIFHAWQSVFLSIFYCIVAIICGIIDDAIRLGGGPAVLQIIWWLLIIALTIFIMIKAHDHAPFGERYTLPIIGSLAASRAIQWAPPGYCKG